jgi:hypothetical protein
MSTPPALRAIDRRLIDDLFEMGGGYVLDFTDRTFSEFFAEELGVRIDDARYRVEGTSKAKRLRSFLKTCDSALLLRTLLALWEYRAASRRRRGVTEDLPNAEDEFFSLVERLGGSRPAPKTRSTASTAIAIDPSLLRELQNELMALSSLAPQPRGYAFERFLKRVFDASGLAGRSSFRVVGEQIDGSFEFSGETYLLEAKWQGPEVGASELRAFNGKVEEKAAWSRGLFVSNSGFSQDGLTAFGRGKRVVCMNGLDLYDMLNRALPFSDVVARKVRYMAETGLPFVPVRDLYP